MNLAFLIGGLISMVTALASTAHAYFIDDPTLRAIEQVDACVRLLIGLAFLVLVEVRQAKEGR